MISNMSPQNQNQPKEQPAPNATPLKADIVSNIPLHQASAPTPVSEAENIDGIMKDVSKEVKKVDEVPKKHHLFTHKEKSKETSQKPVPTAAAPPPPVQTTGPMPRQPAPKAPAHQAEQKSSKPVMVILFTLIITAFLIVAAIAAFKQ